MLSSLVDALNKSLGEETWEALVADLVSGLLRVLVWCYHQEAGSAVRGPNLHWLKVIDYVERELEYVRTREDVASAVGIHPNHLSRLCRLRSGEAFREFLMRKRLQAAVNLLENYQIPLKEIARRCGFSDVRHFSHVFRRRYGMAPGAYRKTGCRGADE
ncbi:MAG: AraC family transcriptional regulator [Lentisphaerae bacterium]|nr:MAG: AraC family transcriptional regulator [Lentisphaerota bacterium]